MKKIISKFVAATTALSLVCVASATNYFDPFSQIQIDGEGVDVGTVETSTLNYGSILEKYKGVLAFLGGLIIITSICMMFYRFYKLSMSGSNDMERTKAIRGILITGVSLMLMGGFSLVLGVSYYLFD